MSVEVLRYTNWSSYNNNYYPTYTQTFSFVAPANSLIVVFSVTASAVYTAPQIDVPSNTGTALTWNELSLQYYDDGSNSFGLGAWYAKNTTSQTIAVNGFSGGDGYIYQNGSIAYVITGHDLTNPIDSNVTSNPLVSSGSANLALAAGYNASSSTNLYIAQNNQTWYGTSSAAGWAYVGAGNFNANFDYYDLFAGVVIKAASSGPSAKFSINMLTI